MTAKKKQDEEVTNDLPAGQAGDGKTTKTKKKKETHTKSNTSKGKKKADSSGAKKSSSKSRKTPKKKATTKRTKKKSDTLSPSAETDTIEEVELPLFEKQALEKKKPAKFVGMTPSSDEGEEMVEEEMEEEFDIEDADKNGIDDRIDAELVHIYENGDGSMPNMQQFDRKRRHRFLRALSTLIVSLLVLGGVAYAYLFIYQPQVQFSQQDVIFSVNGDEEIRSGEEVRYRVRFLNAQRLPLAQTGLQVRYPDGFVFEGSSVESIDEQHTRWDVGTLERDESVTIDIWGRLYGSLDEEQSLRAFLNYLPANFSSEFQKVESLTTAVTEPGVTIDLTGPDEASLGAAVEYAITATPVDDVSGDIALAIDFGPTFIVDEVEPALDDDGLLSLTDREQPTTVTVRGTFDEGERAEPQITARQWQSDERDGDGYVVGTATKEIALLSTDVTANLVINGTLGDFSVQPGDILNTSVTVKNNSETAIDSASVTLTYDVPSVDNENLLDWLQVEDPADGSIVGQQIDENTRRGSITWNRFQVPDLQRLEPGEQVVIDFAVPIKTIDDMEIARLQTYVIRGAVDVQYDEAGERDLVSSNQIALTVNSDLAIDVQHDAENTDHTVRWILTNNFHDLESITVEADLFGDISWKEGELVVPAGEASYDSERQRVTWTVDQMPTSLDVLALQFGFGMNSNNPSQTNLTSGVEVTATDAVTGEEIVLVGREILLNE